MMCHLVIFVPKQFIETILFRILFLLTFMPGTPDTGYTTLQEYLGFTRLFTRITIVKVFNPIPKFVVTFPHSSYWDIFRVVMEKHVGTSGA